MNLNLFCSWIFFKLKTLFSIEPIVSTPIFGITITIIAFIIYWLVSKSKAVLSFFTNSYGKEKTLVYKILFQKFSGFLFLGIVPVLIISFSSYTLEQFGVNSTNLLHSLYWILSLGWAIFLLSFFVSRNPNNYKIYPQIRISKWRTKTIFLNSFSWLLYLLSYEFLFRGILLYSCLDTFGITGSIIINIIIYASAHIPKGLMETIGSLPIGALLCYITISTGNIWAAVVLHLIMALSNDYVSLYQNPKMKISRSNKS